jgi:hypothetical protein
MYTLINVANTTSNWKISSNNIINTVNLIENIKKIYIYLNKRINRYHGSHKNVPTFKIELKN